MVLSFRYTIRVKEELDAQKEELNSLEIKLKIRNIVLRKLSFYFTTDKNNQVAKQK